MNKMLLLSSGIPQGFNPASLIFNIYFNDISVVNSNLLLFDDDIKLFHIIRTLLDTELFQYDLDSISNCCGHFDTNNIH